MGELYHLGIEKFVTRSNLVRLMSNVLQILGILLGDRIHFSDCSTNLISEILKTDMIQVNQFLILNISYFSEQ